MEQQWNISRRKPKNCKEKPAPVPHEPHIKSPETEPGSARYISKCLSYATKHKTHMAPPKITNLIHP
jgi:hypothetical protein